MNKHQPLVSIITPAYNAEKYIAETIQSVLNQSYNNWELLIIDDGSLDQTASIIKSFNEGRIHLITQENRGVSVARNKGLELVNGKYITFLDADDVLPPKSLEMRVNYLESHPNIHLVDGKISVRDMKLQNEKRVYEPYYTGELLQRLVKMDDKVFFNVCYFFRKSILNNTKFQVNMTHAEDLLFYIKLSNKQTINYSYVSEVVYLYRSGHNSAMSNMDGLENGYLSLLNKVRNLKKVSFLQKVYFRYKIARILFLSWLFDKKEPLNAFKSLLYVTNIKKKV